MAKSKPAADSAAALTDRLFQAREDAVVAAAALNAAEAAYRDGLLTGAPAGLRALADAKTDAAIGVDRAAAITAQLETQVADATQTEAEARRHAQYATASALADSARRQLFEVYPEAAERIRRVLHKMAEANIAVDAANQNLPEGERPIAKPDSARSLANLPEVVVSEATVELWHINRHSMPLPADKQRLVQKYSADPRTGFLPAQGGNHECSLSTFIRTDTLDAVVGRHTPPLAEQVVLPGLLFGESPYWAPSGSPDGVLAQSGAPRRPPAVDPEQVSVVTYTLAPRHRGAAAEIEA